MGMNHWEWEGMGLNRHSRSERRWPNRKTFGRLLLISTRPTAIHFQSLLDNIYITILWLLPNYMLTACWRVSKQLAGSHITWKSAVVSPTNNTLSISIPSQPFKTIIITPTRHRLRTIHTTTSCTNCRPYIYPRLHVVVYVVVQLQSVHLVQGRRLRGDEGDMSPPIFRQGGRHALCPPKLTSQCMPFSSLTSFHSIQLQK